MDMQAPAAYEDLATAIDIHLLAPDLTDVQVVDGLKGARRYGVACAVVRPCDIDLAVRTLAGGAVRPGSVVGFPHGSQNTAVKLYELRDLLRRGAREIDMVIAVSKLLSREFQHVQAELDQAADECRRQGATLKVILESARLSEELKIIGCRACARAGVDFVQTATAYAPRGYDVEDVRLVRRHLPEEIGVKAAGGLRGLDQALEAIAAGAARVGASAAAGILDEWRARLAAPPTA